MSARQYALPLYVTKAMEYFNQGNQFFVANQFDLAAEMYRKAISIYPKYYEAYYNLGISLNKLKDLDRAREALEIAMEIRPDDPLVYQELGLNRLLADRPANAIPYYEMAVKLGKSHTALMNLALSYSKLNKFELAKKLYEEALELSTEDPALHYNYAMVLDKLKLHDDAIKHLEDAIRLKPDFTSAYIQLGNIYHVQKNDLQKASEFYHKAKEIYENTPNPDKGEGVIIYYNIASLKSKFFEYDEAIRFYRKALKLDPTHVETHWNLALALLMVEEFEEAFREYTWRWKREKTFNLHIAKPVWNGEDISDKTLLVHTEQGFGDAFMYIRFLPYAKKRCKTLILATRSTLIDIFRHNNFADAYMLLEDVNAYLHLFDVFVPLLDIPFVLGLGKEHVASNIPYITANPTLVEEYRRLFSQYENKFKVVIGWRGNPASESCKVREFGIENVEYLLELDNCVFFNVHPEVETLPTTKSNFVNLAQYVKDFSHTAAIMEAADLTITLDSVLANLGGAMAVETWVVLPYYNEWRWGRHAIKSPWYPTVRLFRQPQEGDWRSIFEVVREELKKKASQVYPA